MFSRLLMWKIRGISPCPVAVPCISRCYQHDMAQHHKSNSERKLLDLVSSSGTYICSRKVYAVSRRFWKEADSRVAAPWPAVAGSFGLHASEGWCYHCPVSHLIPVTNQATQSSRPGGIFFEVPTLLPCARKQARNRWKRSKTTKTIEFYRTLPKTSANPVPIFSFQTQGDIYAKK
jgi:hypothetical protein